MALFGKIDEFVPSKEKFSDYEERLQFYLEANSVTEDSKKRAILLTVIGAHQYRLLKDLCAPRLITEKSFTELCDILKRHHEPPPPKYLRRAVFEARVRQSSESVQAFVAELRKLAEHCDFGAQLEERLCEKFARGINNVEVQRKRLARSDLTLHQAVEIASTTMATTQAAKELQSNGSLDNTPRQTAELHFSNSKSSHHRQAKTTPKSRKHDSKTCGRCGGPHASQSCKFKDATCYKCNKTGHIAKACRSSGPKQQHRHQHQPRPTRHTTHLMEEASHSASGEENFNLFNVGNLQSARPTPIDVEMIVNGEQVTFQLDTGASLTVLTEDDAQQINLPTLRKSTKVLHTYTGQLVDIVGECDVSVTYN